MRELMLLGSLGLLVGCGSGGIAIDEPRDTDVDTDTVADDADTDTDTDTDTDSDTDTDAPTDTGHTDVPVDTGTPAGPRDGTYTGSFELHLTMAGTATGSDVCEGTATLVIDEGGTPDILGTAECEFDGQLAYMGAQSFELTGALLTNPKAAGEITASSGVVSDDWTGNFAADDLNGSFSGTRTSGTTTATWSGTFDVTR